MIPLYKPFMPAVPLVDEILHSGQLAYGRYGRDFERLLGEYIGNPRIVVVSSFNMAVLVALSTLGIRSGDTVIASPMACLASTQPLASMGIAVRWGDVDPKTGTLCPESVLRVAKTSGAKAIIHNHFCGYVGYVDDINQIGRELGVFVIDDCIEAFGSEYKGRRAGNLGADASVFSFNPVRIPNTVDGGAVAFRGDDHFLKSLLVRDAGIDRKRFRDRWGEIDPACDIEIAGHSATFNEVFAYIGTQQMKEVDNLIRRQRRNAAAWRARLAESEPGIVPLEAADSIPNYWVFGILAEERMATMLKFRERGYFASGVHINNNVYSVFGDKRVLPGVEEFRRKFLALPSGWWVEEIRL